MIKFGSNNIGKIYFGSNSIGKAYYGSDLVFQKGSSPTPPPYTTVDYIETDGVAYIDTGILGNDSRSCEIKYMQPTMIYGCILGAYGSASHSYFVLAATTDTGYLAFEHYYSYGGSDGTQSVATSIQNQTPFIVKNAMRKGSQIIELKQEGDSSFTSVSKTNNNAISTGYSMSLFARNTYGTISETCPSGSRLYYCKIYSDATYTTLVRDYVPCLYNGEYGMWDKVSNAFFGNAAASGAFSGPSNQ